MLDKTRLCKGTQNSNIQTGTDQHHLDPQLPQARIMDVLRQSQKPTTSDQGQDQDPRCLPSACLFAFLSGVRSFSQSRSKVEKAHRTLPALRTPKIKQHHQISTLNFKNTAKKNANTNGQEQRAKTREQRRKTKQCTNSKTKHKNKVIAFVLMIGGKKRETNHHS
jgi:hypothetical protein